VHQGLFGQRLKTAMVLEPALVLVLETALVLELALVLDPALVLEPTLELPKQMSQIPKNDTLCHLALGV